MIDVDPQFLAFLGSEESRSWDGTLLQEVEAAIDSYNGAPYGDEDDGRSQVVARDVAEVIDYMNTSVLDVFVGSGRVVEFEPQSEADEDVCDDATEALHYLYRRKSGYRFIHDWAKAGLLEKIGIAKTYAESKKKRVDALYHPAMLPENAIQAQPAMQPHPETGEQVPIPHPADGEPMIRAVTLEDSPVQFCDVVIPIEEFRIAPDARDFEGAVYLAHITEKSLSDLLQMGFDPELVKTAQGNGNPVFSGIAQSRDDGRTDWTGLADRDGANRKVWLNEEYVLYDLDEDGIAERLCVHRVGNTVLDIQPIDYQPFEFWCPFPMQGRLVGQSLADKSMDIQRVNTVLYRNGLDSLYSQVAPGHYVSEECENEHTVDDLLTIRPNRLVRFKGQVPPIAEQKNDVSKIAFDAIEFMIRQRESRTGITRLNKGVDEDTLNETAKGQAQLMARGQQMERYIVRNFAEGVARLFMKKVDLMRRHGQPFQIRVDGQYRQVDPSQWPEDMEVNVVVGLGSGSKQDRIMHRQMVAQAQSMAMMNQSPVCTWENVFNNLSAMARDMGLPPNDVWTDPAQNPAAQQGPPPDPKTQALQAQLAIKQQEVQQRGQMDQQKLQLEAAKHEGQLTLQAQNDHAQAEIALRQQNVQAWLDQQQMKLEADKHVATLDSHEKIAKMRPGGALDK